MRKHNLVVRIFQDEFTSNERFSIGRLVSTRYNIFKNEVLFKVQLLDASLIETSDAASIEVLSNITLNMQLREMNSNISHPCALISSPKFPFYGRYVLMNSDTRRLATLTQSQRYRLTIRNGWKIACISSISKVR